jgi:hypothetical protein
MGSAARKDGVGVAGCVQPIPILSAGHPPTVFAGDKADRLGLREGATGSGAGQRGKGHQAVTTLRQFGLLMNATIVEPTLSAIRGEGRAALRSDEMTLCPIAIVAGCQKCPAFKVCPLKTAIGDQPIKPPSAGNGSPGVKR